MAISGIVDIDVFQSSALKERKPQNEIDQLFKEYHSLVEDNFEIFKGEIWHRMGDGAICIFPTPADAVDACIRLLENLVAFNKHNEILLRESPLFVRIGIHEIPSEDVVKVPKDERGKFAHSALDITGKLQKNCPIGKIAISMEVYKNLKFDRRLFRPSLGDMNGERFFVLLDRSIMPQEEKLFDGLSENQKKIMPPIPFLSWDKIKPNDKINLTTLNEIFKEPLIAILGETKSEPKGPISSAATSDAVGMMEVMAALRSHQDVRVGIDQWEDTRDIISERNIIIIGSGIVNIYAFALNDIFSPVHFIKTKGRVYDKIVTNKEEYFGPHTSSLKDCGLIIISKSPFNLEKVLLYVAGITGMGTQAAANILKDLILDAGGTLKKIGVLDSNPPIACVVGAETREFGDDRELSDYYKRWRVLDYKVLWMVDRNGNNVLEKKKLPTAV